MAMMTAARAAAMSMIESMESWEDFLEYVAMYGAQIALVTCLSAVAVYRREMSCNRVFHEEPEPADDDRDAEDESDRTRQHRRRGPTHLHGHHISLSDVGASVTVHGKDQILDILKSYCSSAPFINFAHAWLERWDHLNRELDRKAVSMARDERHTRTHDGEDGGGFVRANPWDDLSPEELLDSVGNYCSGEPLLAAISLLSSSKRVTASAARQARRNNACNRPCPYSRNLPNDVHGHIASFLHPRDVVNLACVSRSYCSIVDEGEVSMAIWRTLWLRDYGWILSRWEVGQQAAERSGASPVFSKAFYFRFGQSYIDYVLAGQNTNERCLVGLHSNIYDITPFLHLHPGSPDTLMVHAGKDATRFFEDMGHSLSARRMARSLCVVVDRSGELHECGLHPTVRTMQPLQEARENRSNNTHCKNIHNGDTDSGAEDIRFPPPVEDHRLCKNRKGQRTTKCHGTLRETRNAMQREHEVVTCAVERRYAADASVLGDVNVYYDPLVQKWQAWYTNISLETVFVKDM